jgi:hypothetical protein
MMFQYEPAKRVEFVGGESLWFPAKIRIWRLRIQLCHWHKPLQTQHHLYPRRSGKAGGGRPRAGRRVDWDMVLGNGVGPWRLLWIYTRDKEGQPLGRTIEWCWTKRGGSTVSQAHE